MKSRPDSAPRMRVPMSSPDIGDAERQAVLDVLETPFLSNGPQVRAFEESFCSYVGRKHAIAVSSGTAGLHLALIDAGVKRGDVVVTTPFSFVASANIALYEGAIPVFVDVDPLTGNIDAEQLVDAMDDLRRGGDSARRWLPRRGADTSKVTPDVGAVVAVHVFGQPADMDPIARAAQESNVSVIEDACEALGASYRGRNAGTLGDHAVFAFYPNKQITTGEGGMILTDDDQSADLFRSLRNQGRDVFDAWLRHSRLGYNYRLDEMSAALGNVQLSRVDEILKKREQVAEWYGRELAGYPKLQIPHVVPATTRYSWFVYVVRLDAELVRDDVMVALEERGVPSRPYFEPIHLQPFYREMFGYEVGDFPVAESLSRSCLALPFSGVMTEEQVVYVCQTVREVLG